MTVSRGEGEFPALAIVAAIREEVARAATKAAWPMLISMRDLAWILDLDASAARRRAGAGEFGPAVRIGRRVYVERDRLLASLDREGAKPRTTEARGNSTGRQEPEPPRGRYGCEHRTVSPSSHFEERGGKE